MWGREAAFRFFCLVEGEGAVIVMDGQTLKAVRKDVIPASKYKKLKFQSLTNKEDKLPDGF